MVAKHSAASTTAITPVTAVLLHNVPESAGQKPTGRVDGRTMAMKMRLEPVPEISAPRVHPGFDWFLVLEGRVLLQLGDRRIEVTQGEAAEFSTMTPHAISAIDDPAELVMVFDREGQRAHLHR